MMSRKGLKDVCLEWEDGDYRHLCGGDWERSNARTNPSDETRRDESTFPAHASHECEPDASRPMLCTTMSALHHREQAGWKVNRASVLNRFKT